MCTCEHMCACMVCVCMCVLYVCVCPTTPTRRLLREHMRRIQRCYRYPYTYTHTHIHMHMRIHLYTHAHKHTHIHIHTYMHTYAHTRAAPPSTYRALPIPIYRTHMTHAPTDTYACGDVSTVCRDPTVSLELDTPCMHPCTHTPITQPLHPCTHTPIHRYTHTPIHGSNNYHCPDYNNHRCEIGALASNARVSFLIPNSLRVCVPMHVCVYVCVYACL